MTPRIRSSQEQQEFENYIEALLGSGSEDAILHGLSDLDVPEPYRVRFKILYSSRVPSAVLGAFVEKRTLDAFPGKELSFLSKASSTYVYSKKLGQKSQQQVRVPFLLAGFQDIGPEIKTVIAVCRSNQWRALQSFFRRRYPSLVPVLLSQAELVRGARSLTTVSGHEVRVRAFSAKESIRGTGGTWRKSVREWTDEDLGTVLRDIEERRQTLTSLDVDFYPTVGQYSHIHPKVSCKIRKDGEIAITGSFELAFGVVAKHVARVGANKLRFFKGRGLRESNYQPQPIGINFSRPTFNDVKVVRDFVALLAKYPHSIHATAHGNPYANVRVTDLLDGSSFDVWAVPPQKIAFIPGLKASEAAFERLIHYIFDVFREGQVVTYDRDERRLEATI